MPAWQVILLGLLEGLTEFIPVSSTGHLLLAGHFLGFESPKKVFEVLIQLGAILAILSVYAGKLWQMLLAFPHDAQTRKFVLSILLAFLPAAVIGVLLHSIIKGVFFESPALVCWMLILGGVVLLLVDRLRLEPHYHEVTQLPPAQALKIGLFQCLAMVPGVSRSGATIIGAMLLGADKRTAAEFSFFLAMPTMAGAFAYDLYKNFGQMSGNNWFIVVVGFATSFVAAFFVVKTLLEYVSSHGFGLFAWWRIILGAVGLIGLGLFK